MQKAVISLSITKGMDLKYLMGLSLFELKEILKVVAEIGKEQRVRNGNKNRRRN